MLRIAVRALKIRDPIAESVDAIMHTNSLTTCDGTAERCPAAPGWFYSEIEPPSAQTAIVGTRASAVANAMMYQFLTCRLMNCIICYPLDG